MDIGIVRCDFSCSLKQCPCVLETLFSKGNSTESNNRIYRTRINFENFFKCRLGFVLPLQTEIRTTAKDEDLPFPLRRISGLILILVEDLLISPLEQERLAHWLDEPVCIYAQLTGPQKLFFSRNAIAQPRIDFAQ